MVQTVKVAIERIILAQKNGWSSMLAIFERRYRGRETKDKYSPYFLMFDKAARHPRLELFGGTHEKDELIAGGVSEACRIIALLATESNRANCMTEEKKYRTNWIKVGDAVMVGKANWKGAPALKPIWGGPVIVIRAACMRCGLRNEKGNIT